MKDWLGRLGLLAGGFGCLGDGLGVTGGFRRCVLAWNYRGG